MILMAFMKDYSKEKVPLVKHLQCSKATIRPKNASIPNNSVINHTKKLSNQNDRGIEISKHSVSMLS